VTAGRSRGRPNSALAAPMLSHHRSRFRVLYGTRRSSRSKTYGSILSYDVHTAPGDKSES